MDKRQKNNLMTTITLIVVLGQFILWIILLLLDKKQQGTALAVLFICLINKLKKDMTLEQFQNLKIGDIVVAKLVNSKQSRVNPVTNIDRGNLKLHIGKSGKWRSYLQFEVLTADYVVKWIKRRIDSKSSPHFTIEVKSDTEVTFKVHKKVQFNQ